MNKRLISSAAAAAMAVTGMCGMSMAVYADDVTNIVIETVTLGDDYPDIAAVEEAINAITEPEIGVSVSILNVGIAEHANRLSLMVAGGEQLDLCMAGLTTNLASMVSDGMIYELDDAVAEYGPAISEVYADTLEAGVVDGVLYGIPADNTAAQAGGFIYNKELVDEAGIEIPERTTLGELEEAFMKVKELHPELYLTSMGNGTISSANVFSPITVFGDSSQFSYGVILNPAENTTIENWFATDTAKEYYTMMKRWHDDGLIPADSLTNGIIASDAFRAGQLFGIVSAYSPIEISIQASGYDFEVGMTQITDAWKDSDKVQERMWAVPATSASPEKAIEFLNYMIENVDVANLLTYGIEGTHYQVTGDGIITLDENIAAGYASVFSKFGDQTKIYYKAPAEEGVQEALKEFSEAASECVALGYVFNSESVSPKVAAVSNVVQQYGPALETGVVSDVEESLNQIVEMMNQAGMESVVEENQAQLDAWLAEK